VAGKRLAIGGKRRRPALTGVPVERIKRSRSTSLRRRWPDFTGVLMLVLARRSTRQKPPSATSCGRSRLGDRRPPTDRRHRRPARRPQRRRPGIEVIRNGLSERGACLWQDVFRRSVLSSWRFMLDSIRQSGRADAPPRSCRQQKHSNLEERALCRKLLWQGPVELSRQMRGNDRRLCERGGQLPLSPWCRMSNNPYFDLSRTACMEAARAFDVECSTSARRA